MSRKVFILVGYTGSGKSTTGNCILNQQADLNSIQRRPFPTSDSSVGCTRRFSSMKNANVTILDTVGFGDPQYDPNEIFGEFKRALDQVDNQVDCVLFMVRKGRFTQVRHLIFLSYLGIFFHFFSNDTLSLKKKLF